MFFGDRKRKKLTAAQFDKEVEALVQFVKSSVSPFAHDTKAQQQERVRRAREDQDYFNATYLPHYFPQPSPEFHREMEALIEEGENQQRPVAVAAPRGHAKSTRITFARALKKAICGEKKFIIEVSDTETQARGFTVSIRVELEHNQRILHDFGAQKTSQWAAGDFVAQSGCRIMARGDGQGIRGLKHGPYRPDLVIIDDVENDESVRNPERIKQTYQWIMEAIVPSLDPATGVLFIVGTLLSKKSVLAQCLANTAFLTATYRAIAGPQWDEATQQFTGGVPLWGERFSLRKLSSVRHLVGSLSFSKEYQNEPLDDDAMFKESWLRRVRYDALPNQPAYIYQAIDPSLKSGQQHDFKAEATILRIGTHYYVRHVAIKRQSIDAMIRQAYDLHARFQALQVGLEVEGWQSLLRREFDRVATDVKRFLPIVPITHAGISKDSDARIGGLSPMVENGVLVLCDGPVAEVGDMEVLIEQLLHFPTPSVHDDGPDALEMAVRLAERRASGKITIETFDRADAVHFAQEGAW